MGTPLHALLVEDSAEDAELLTYELRWAGYDVTGERVETAERLTAALAHEEWDIVLCDFTLPRFSGKAALRIVKETHPDLPFIYVSGTIGEETAVEAMKAGAHDYVMKENLRRLAPAVERELREADLRREHHRAEAERQRLLAELQATLVEIKRLSGLLPICSRCKRIHDEDGSWLTVEEYVAARAPVQFTHGVCPECARRLYPEIELDEERKD